MAITRTAMVDDDGTGTTGTILNNAWKTELYNQIDAADLALVPSTWVAWTPLWKAATTQPVLGNGTLTGRYALLNKTVHFVLVLKMGSTTTYGSGFYYFSLPFAPIDVAGIGYLGAGLHFPAGIVNAGGTASAPSLSYGFSATEFYLVSSAGALVAPTVPITFNANCLIVVRGTYERI
jgi:hypothetical protein